VPDPASAADLLKSHLPLLRYDSQGSYMADSPAILTNRISPDGQANALRRSDGTVIADAAGGRRRPRLELGFLGWLDYHDGQKAARSDYLDAVGRDYVLQAREMHRGDFADRIHGRAVPADDGGWWLQYWFFYLHNNKAFLGLGLHEGDWEMVQVALAADERPTAVAFAQHTHGERCGWDAIKKHGQRPIVYVARGSQASYASPGRHDAPFVPDYADGKGPYVDHATLVEIGEGQPWIDWPGRWGSTRARVKGESDSPRGPSHQDKWRHPATFHEECDEVDPRRMAPEAPPPSPPKPRIEARRVGGHAVVSYRIPKADGRPAAVALIVSLDSPDDALPPATDMQTIEGNSGELEHPLELEDKRYEVRVTAADADGNASEQAVVALA